MSRLDQQYSTPEEVRAKRVQAQLDFYYEHRDGRGDYRENVAFDGSMRNYDLTYGRKKGIMR